MRPTPQSLHSAPEEVNINRYKVLERKEHYLITVLNLLRQKKELLSMGNNLDLNQMLRFQL
jgi:hypothetical protein